MSDNNVTLARILELKGSDTQDVFGNKINMSQSNVSKLLGGTPPSASTLIQLASAYQVSVDWLLGLSDNKTNSSNLDLSNLTYSDLLSLFDQLYERGTLEQGWDVNGFNNERDPGLVVVNDKVLLYLLRSLKAAEEVNADMAKLWKEQTVKFFSKVPVKTWDSLTNGLYEEHKPNPESNEAVKKLLDEIEDGTIKLDSSTLLYETGLNDLPFK